MENETLIQYFHWYLPSDGQFWNQVAKEAANLKKCGITHVWLPPAYKASDGKEGVGYAVYDLYDLGEFDQKGTIRTKYGTKDEYVNASKKLHEAGLKIMVDVILNHRCEADEVEKIMVQEYNTMNRLETIGEVIEKETLIKFTFPGRNGKYSSFIWDHTCFTGTDDQGKENRLFRIINEHGQDWEEVESKEFGNFDFLMGADVEFRNPFVKEELKNWGKWYYETVQLDGVRLDALKHMNTNFIKEWIDFMKSVNKNLFVIGELWTQNLEELLNYIKSSEGKIRLFDVPLHYNFYQASTGGSNYDMRKILEGTLVQASPEHAITFDDNHDTQPMRDLDSTVDFWFKPLSAAILYLREHGVPCVFYPSLNGAKYKAQNKEGKTSEIELISIRGTKEMLFTRKEFSYGIQRDYFDHPNTIGWIREGIEEKEDSGCAVVMTNGIEGYKAMEIGKGHAGKIFVDALKSRKEEIHIDENGWATFPVNGGSVAVWIRKEAFGKLTEELK
jgi:alpha-amylase